MISQRSGQALAVQLLYILCFELPSVLLKNRTEKFRKKYIEYHYILATIYT